MQRRKQPSGISTLIAAAAAGMVETQKRFDRAYEDDCDSFARVLAAAPADPLRSIVMDLAPARPLAGSQEIEFRIQVEVVGSTEFSLQAAPLNLGFDVRYETTASNTSRVRLMVQQTTAVTNGGMDGDEAD